MKRFDRINRLTKVGFSATELSRMPNESLIATYEAAKHLMEAKNEELDKVRRQESLRAKAMKRQLAEKQKARDLELRWLSGFKPLKPITAESGIIIRDNQNPAERIRLVIKEAEARRNNNTAMFRSTGDQAYAEAANEDAGILELLREALEEQLS